MCKQADLCGVWHKAKSLQQSESTSGKKTASAMELFLGNAAYTCRFGVRSQTPEVGATCAAGSAAGLPMLPPLPYHSLLDLFFFGGG